MSRYLRILLLLLLPGLLLAALVYGKSGTRIPTVISVSSGGDEVIFLARSLDPQTPNTLVQVSNGNRIERRLQPRTSVVGVGVRRGNEIIVGCGRELSFFDAQTLELIRNGVVLKPDQDFYQLVVSKNGRFAAASYLQDRVVHWVMINLDDMDHVPIPAGFDPTADAGLHSLVVFQVASSRTYLIDRIVNFETGKLQTELRPSQYDLGDVFSHNLRFAAANVPKPKAALGFSIEIIEIQAGASKQVELNGISNFPRLQFFATKENRLLASDGDKLYVIDAPTGQIIHNALKFGGSIRGKFVFSPDSKTVACTTNLKEIEVWNIETGKRMHKIAAQPPPWILWSIVLFGSTAWSLAWLWTGWNNRESRFIVSDLVIVSFLGLAALFLRFSFAGPTIEQYSAAGFFGFLGGMSALVALWSVFGLYRPTLRFPAAIVAMILIWAGPLFVWQYYELMPGNGITVVCLVPISMVWVMSFWLKRHGWRVDLAHASSSKINMTLQFPMLDLFLLPAVVGLMIVSSKLVSFPDYVSAPQLRFFLLLCLTQALIILVASWSTLAMGRFRFRILVGTSLVLTLALCLLPFYWNPGTVNAIAIQIGVAIYIVVALSLVRRAGWRVHRVKSLIAPT